MAQASEAVIENPRRGRPKGSKDRQRPKRGRPDLRLNAVVTAIRAANAAGFDLSIEKSGGIILSPKVPAETVSDNDNTKEPPE
jgi:hypothetical protein